MHPDSLVSHRLRRITCPVQPPCVRIDSSRPNALPSNWLAARHACQLHEGLVIATDLKLQIRPFPTRVSDKTRCFAHVRLPRARYGRHTERGTFTTHMDIRAIGSWLISNQALCRLELWHLRSWPAQLPQICTTAHQPAITFSGNGYATPLMDPTDILGGINREHRLFQHGVENLLQGSQACFFRGRIKVVVNVHRFEAYGPVRHFKGFQHTAKSIERP